MTASVHVTLAAHPANPARFHQHVEATLTRAGDGSLLLDYRIRGKLSTSLGLLRTVPFDEKGSISLDSLTRRRGGA